MKKNIDAKYLDLKPIVLDNGVVHYHTVAKGQIPRLRFVQRSKTHATHPGQWHLALSDDTSVSFASPALTVPIEDWMTLGVPTGHLSLLVAASMQELADRLAKLADGNTLITPEYVRDLKELCRQYLSATRINQDVANYNEGLSWA